MVVLVGDDGPVLLVADDGGRTVELAAAGPARPELVAVAPVRLVHLDTVVGPVKMIQNCMF